MSPGLITVTRNAGNFTTLYSSLLPPHPTRAEEKAFPTPRNTNRIS